MQTQGLIYLFVCLLAVVSYVTQATPELTMPLRITLDFQSSRWVYRQGPPLVYADLGRPPGFLQAMQLLCQPSYILALATFPVFYFNPILLALIFFNCLDILL